MAHDLVIVGAGSIGCALAREARRRQPALSVCVVEQEAGPAGHTSGRNSGVVHSGFNPAPGTLKARLCVEGSRLIREFCAEHAVPCEEVGTLVAARTPQEERRLEELLRRGRENGVPGIRIIGRAEARQLEPNLAPGIVAVLHSPTGAILDSRAFVRAVAGQAEAAGAALRYGARLTRVQRTGGSFRLTLDDGHELTCGRVLNAAGAWVDQVARMFGVGDEYRIIPFRGQYWRVRGKDDLIRSMVYPVPDPAFPFLGVHVTKQVGDGVILGPNAMLALGRDAYSFWSVNPRDLVGMVRAPHFWRLMRRPDILRLAADEIQLSLSRERFAHDASRLVAGIRPEDLAPGPPAGIRAQLVDRHGELVEDFLLELADGSAHVMNAVSPGLTCSLAFAAYLIDRLQAEGFF